MYLRLLFDLQIVFIYFNSDFNPTFSIESVSYLKTLIMKVTGQNALLKGVSGKFGNQLVVRQRKGSIVIASIPNKSTKPPTKARKKGMSRFKRAVIFARQVIANPALLSLYEIRVKPNQTVYHAAISAYMRSEDEMLNPR